MSNTTHPLALSVINDGKHYRTRKMRHAGWAADQFKGYISLLVNYTARDEARRFGSTFTASDIAQAITDVIEHHEDFKEDEEAFELAAMAAGYIEAAYWTDADDQVENAGDLHPDSQLLAEKDCTDFFNANRANMIAAVSRDGYTWGRAGHDLWLTRNGHGAGFWDRSELKKGGIGDKLSEACQHKEMDLIVGDDGLCHFEGRQDAFAEVAK